MDGGRPGGPRRTGVKPDILSLDVGTTTFKLGVFDAALTLKYATQRSYAARVSGTGHAEIDPGAWWEALRDACAEAGPALARIGVISLSVTTPGLTPMAEDGTALAPAVLFFDARSSAQAARTRELVGAERLLEETCNLPVSGGSSLASILWFRDERPDIWRAAAKFGHTNTYLTRRLTGRWAIDPSSTSITCLYNTARNDLTWNQAVLEAMDLPPDRLPPLLQSYDPVGPILPAVADELGLPRGAVVLCGGNDAVLGSLSVGLGRRGQVSLMSGTCDIASVCIDAPLASPNFNVRCHILPGRWLTFFVLNTGGSALDWFRQVFCSEMTPEVFFGAYVPGVLERHLAGDDELEAQVPTYDPYLAGSRYTLDRLTAGFGNVTLATRREDFLVALIRGNAAVRRGEPGRRSGRWCRSSRS